MKRKVILLLLLLFPFSIAALNLESNFNGIVVGNSTSNPNHGVCDSIYVYYWADGAAENPREGIRITFYDLNGNQIGNTVDVWSRIIHHDYLPEYSGDEVIRSDDANVKKELEIVNANGFTAYKNKIEPYNVLKIEKDGKKYETISSRIDYMKTNYNYKVTSNNISNDKSVKQKIERVQGKYIYYIDNNASKFTKCSRPLYYSKDGAECLKKYFQTVSVMQRYINLAGATNAADINEGNYIMTIEPIILVTGCDYTSQYRGIYTATELGLLNKYFCEEVNYYGINLINWVGCTKDTNANLKVCIDSKKSGVPYDGIKYYFENTGRILCGMDNFILRRTVSMLFTLNKDIKIAGYNFKKIDTGKNSKDVRVTTENYRLSFIDMMWTDGFGIGAVIGTDICGDHCGAASKYTIVYHKIDLNNPFMDINGNKRTLSKDSNWYGKENTIDPNIYSKTPKYTVVLDPVSIKSIRDEKTDYNKITIDSYKTFKTNYANLFR